MSFHFLIAVAYIIHCNVAVGFVARTSFDEVARIHERAMKRQPDMFGDFEGPPMGGDDAFGDGGDDFPFGDDDFGMDGGKDEFFTDDEFYGDDFGPKFGMEMEMPTTTPAATTTPPAPAPAGDLGTGMKLPSDGGKLEQWYEQSKLDMANGNLQERLCAGGTSGDAGWRGSCAEYVRASSIYCTEDCRHLRGGSDHFGTPVDDSTDVCEARDERTCYNVCLGDKLFDDEDKVLGNNSVANPPCNENQTYAERNSVRKEREGFWKDVMESTVVNVGDSFWKEEWEWKAEKEATKKLHAQFDSFWNTVCKEDSSAVCQGVKAAPKLTKKTFFLRKRSKTSNQLQQYLHSKHSHEAYKAWFERSQFPGVVALSANCHLQKLHRSALHSIIGRKKG